MGWGYYEINDKPCGYSVAATCDEPGCDRKIDRGLSYCCGGMPETTGYCGGYFCGNHLYIDVDGDGPQSCRSCDGALR